MKNPLHILHLEDDPNDAELIALQLASDGTPPTIALVKSQKEFSAALDRGGIDVILADNSGPTFNGRDALELARKKAPKVPFLFVTGSSVGDEAIEVMKAGADGYVPKDKLSQLSPAIQSAIRAKK